MWVATAERSTTATCQTTWVLMMSNKIPLLGWRNPLPCAQEVDRTESSAPENSSLHTQRCQRPGSLRLAEVAASLLLWRATLGLHCAELTWTPRPALWQLSGSPQPHPCNSNCSQRKPPAPAPQTQILFQPRPTGFISTSPWPPSFKCRPQWLPTPPNLHGSWGGHTSNI